MSKENIIKTIKIEIAGVEVEVTPLQAKNLHEALAGLLGLDKPPVTEKHVHHYDRYWYPTWQPTWYLSGTGTITRSPSTTVTTASVLRLDGCDVTYNTSTSTANLSVL